MKKSVVTLVLICIAIQLQAQTAVLYRQADSLVRQKEYKMAAASYANAIRQDGPNVWASRYSTLAGIWSRAGEADSAFSYLAKLTDSRGTNKLIANNLEYGAEFNSLRSDKRWQPLFSKIKTRAEANGYVQTEWIYGRKDGIALTLIQIRPKVKPNGKAVINVVSGGWFSSYNGIEMETYYQDQYLEKGYTVFSVMHGSTPRYAIPDAISDLKRAIRYIRYNAKKFGIDPDKLGITGGSAGGHLSLAVATADDQPDPDAPDPVDRVSSRVQAVAVLFPPTDVLNWGGPGFNMVNAKDLVKARGAYGAIDFKVWNSKFMIYEEVSDPEARNKIGREISPIYHVSADDPPVFIVHGDSDKTVPLQQSESIIAKFKQAGVKNRLVVKKGADHNGEQMKPEYMEFVNWFDECLK